MDASVVICCYNSKSRLKPTLQYLSEQQVSSHISWEVVLVDNHSNDGTSDYARKLWEGFKTEIPFQIVFEPLAGLSYARKKGVYEAAGELVIFCDDDNWLCTDYVVKSVQIMKNNPETGVAAGVGIAVSDIELPDWFNDFEKMCYACGQYNETSGDVTAKKWVWGAGMVLRRLVLLNLYKMGIKHQTTDRKKKNLASGGDREICFWFILTGYRLWYDLDLRFYHFLSGERLNLEYFKKLRKEQLKSSDLLVPQLNLVYSWLNFEATSKTIRSSLRFLTKRLFYREYDYRYLFTSFSKIIFLKEDAELKELANITKKVRLQK